MGKVIFNMSMSLDGYVAGPTDEGTALHDWYSSGDTDLPPFKVSKASADLLRGAFASAGALITGRRTFDVSEAWEGHPPLGVPCFVLTTASRMGEVRIAFHVCHRRHRKCCRAGQSGRRE